MAILVHAAVLLLFPGAVAGEILGGVRVDGRVYSWGDALREHTPRDRAGRLLASGPFQSACMIDADGDGGLDAVVRQGPSMLWLEAPRFQGHVIDTGADFTGCLAAALFGRRGVVLIHRGAQVRFYQPPPEPRAQWPYREIYSIYTPSLQGGLLALGADLVAGNYLIRSPAEADLPWRLFAINNWWERERSALLHWIADGDALIAAETEGSRVSRFRRPDDLAQFWSEEPLFVALDGPRAAAVAGDAIYAADRGGLWRLRGGRAERILERRGIVGLWADGPALWILDQTGLGVRR